jgi:hypothetical protein
MSRARAPRGTGTLKRAFYDAARHIPEDKRGEIIKAAIASIRDDLRAETDKARAARQKARVAAGKKPIGRPRVAKAA